MKTKNPLLTDKVKRARKKSFKRSSPQSVFVLFWSVHCTYMYMYVWMCANWVDEFYVVFYYFRGKKTRKFYILSYKNLIVKSLAIKKVKILYFVVVGDLNSLKVFFLVGVDAHNSRWWWSTCSLTATDFVSDGMYIHTYTHIKCV